MNRSELLITYGHRILESNQFANAKDQKHHFRTDVASHSINVALYCILSASESFSYKAESGNANYRRTGP